MPAFPLRYLQLHRPLLGYFLAYALIVGLILPPTGQAFLSDDGDYAFTVLDWVEHGRLYLTDFPSMTLIGHLGWGYLFASLFGNHQLVLRISTMVMAWLGGLAIYDLVYRYRKDSSLAAFTAAAYVFNPLLFLYSYTFNTDVAGCSMTLVFLAAANRIGHRPQRWQAAALGALAGYCFLIRQTAAVAGILYGLWLLVPLFRRTLKLDRVLVYWLMLLAAPAAYFSWLGYSYGWPLGYERGFLSFEVLLKPKIALVKAFRMGMAMGLYGLPMLCLVARWPRRGDRRPWVLAILGSLLGAAMFCVPSLLPLRPCWDVDLFDFGFGKALEIDQLRGHLFSPKLWSEPYPITLFELISVILGTLGMFLGIYLLFFHRHAWWVLLDRTFNPNQPDGRWLTMLTLLGQWMLVLMIWIVYDRYFLPILSVMLVAVAIMPAMRRRNPYLGQLVLFGFALVSVIATQDCRVQGEAAVKLARQLEAQAIAPYNIWFGHQYFVAEAYGPHLRQQLDIHGGRLKNIDYDARWAMAQWPREAQYHLRSLRPGQPFTSGLPALEFSSWLRKYRFEVFKTSTPEAYEKRLQRAGS
jgi:hypothetical protein